MFRKLIFLSLGFLPTVLMAGGSEELQKFLNNVSSAEGSFDQTVVDKSGKLLDGPSTGVFAFSRPGKFVWEYETPYEQRIVSNGKTLWIWDKDLNQVTVRRLKGAIPASPASVLFGQSDLKRDWIVSDEPASDGYDWVKLEAKEHDAAFSEVFIGFKDGLPAKLKFTGSLGETSTLTFENLKTGAGNTASQYEFKIPKDADVLKAD